ncbi:Ig-like domain-containing protein [Myxococcus llanfairpwllgwyngyllgogerychwyrndrobwllllantysiliogogogochensis]|nr:Ig-like domain-containing protein [Myxococcus llanfairpwllgwyngyllgogerychwyrndrobwllllantysiliogogogochensis]
MGLRKWLLGGCVFMVASCDSAPLDEAAREKSPSRVQAERLAAEHGFDLREVTLVPAPGDTGDRHSLHFQGIPIQGLEARTTQGVTSLTNVRFAATTRPQMQARVTAAQAEATVLAEMKDASARVEESRLMFLPQEERRLKPGVPTPAAGRAHNADHFERVVTGLTLVHQLHLLTGNEPAGVERRWSAQVDARSGQLLRLEPLAIDLAGGTYKPVSGYGYFSGRLTHSVLFENRLYVLQDPRGNKYQAMLSTESLPGSVIEDYVSIDAKFGDGRLFNPTNEENGENGESAAVDAMFAVNLAWGVYESLLSRDGPTGAGLPFEVWLHAPMGNAEYNPSNTRPRLEIGYRTFPAGVTAAGGLLVPLSTTDIIGHELGHDFFMRELARNPATFPSGRTEMHGMNEGTGDIFGFVTELARDAARVGGTALDIDAVPLKTTNLTMGEEAGPVMRNLIDPIIDIWFDGIGGEETHRAGGPLVRMFLLLAYGCTPWQGEQSTDPWSSFLVPEGFSGLGPTAALRLWSRAVLSMPLGADYAQARQATLEAVISLYGASGSTQMKAVGSAFAAINVGDLPDTNPPTAVLSCTQVGADIECTGTITDAETPNKFHTPPQLILDGGNPFPLPGWQFTLRMPGAALKDGTHTVRLKAWDFWQNATTTTVSVVLDKKPPVLSVTRLGPLKQPYFSVTATDDSGIERVEYFDNSVWRSTVSMAPFDNEYDTSTWPDGTHDILIKAFDRFLNVTMVHHALDVDNTPPNVSMTVGGSAPPFIVNASVSDISTITRVDFKVDGVVFATRTNSATSYVVQYTPIDPLAHNLSVEVTDAFGNKSVRTLAAPRDVTPPAVTFEKTQLGSLVRLTFGASDICGLVYPYGLYVDGTLVALPTTPGYVLEFGANMADGPHAFHAVVHDNCGNTTNFETVFFKGITPPVITGITRDDSQPKSPKFTVQCVDTDGVHHVEMRENGVVMQIDTTAPYEFIVDTSARQDGDSILLFQCSDLQGAASTPVTRTVTADNTGPSYTFTVFGAGRTYFVSAGTVSDPRGIQSVVLSGGLIPGFNVTLTQAPYSLTWSIPNIYSFDTQLPFSLLATDKWGNTSNTSLACPVDTASTEPALLFCQVL